MILEILNWAPIQNFLFNWLKMAHPFQYVYYLPSSIISMLLNIHQAGFWNFASSFFCSSFPNLFWHADIAFSTILWKSVHAVIGSTLRIGIKASLNLRNRLVPLALLYIRLTDKILAPGKLYFWSFAQQHTENLIIRRHLIEGKFMVPFPSPNYTYHLIHFCTCAWHPPELLKGAAVTPPHRWSRVGKTRYGFFSRKAILCPEK